MENSDLRPRVVALEKADLDHHHRITQLEAWQQKKDVTDSQQDQRWDRAIQKLGERLTTMELNTVEKITALAVEFSGTKKDLSAIKKALWAVNFLIVAAFIGSITYMIWHGSGDVRLPQ